jgi:hypothetical protein
MKILNLTHSEFWLPGHFKYTLRQTGHTGETMFRPIYNMNAQTANALWQEHKDYFDTFDAIFVSHLSTWSRVFLQNNWTKPLYIWLFFRFDFDIDDREAYNNLLREAVNKPNVKIFAATETDRVYAEQKLNFSIPIIKPFICINNDCKTAIACGADTFYLVGKHNESLHADKLAELGVPTYRQDWTASIPDLRGVRGVIHLPYVYATRSFIENLAIENVYFLPSAYFLNILRRHPSYFWDGTIVQDHFKGDYSLTEWYSPEHTSLFVYFDSFEELRDLSLSTYLPETITRKKNNIREFVAKQNEKALQEWTELLQ